MKPVIGQNIKRKSVIKLKSAEFRCLFEIQTAHLSPKTYQ